MNHSIFTSRVLLPFVSLAAASTPSSADESCYVEEALLVASDGAPGDQFGLSVAISGDTVIVGAPKDQSSDGSAYVFVRSGSVWVQQAKLVPSPTCFDCEFGNSVAISGDVAIVGAWFDHLGDEDPFGSAYVFRRTGSTWVQEKKLVGSDTQLTDYFGISVATDGHTALVGADFAQKVYAFQNTGNGWPEAAILHSNYAYFGQALALSGDTLLVGAPPYPGTAPGRVIAFVGGGASWTQQGELEPTDAPGSSFGTAVTLDGDYALVGEKADGEHGPSAGSVHVFARSADQWNQQAKLFEANGPSGPGMYFGTGVGISGRLAIVATLRESDGSSTLIGGEDLFSRTGSSWNLVFDFGPGPIHPGGWGRSVAIDGDTIASGTSAGNGYVRILRPAPSTGTLECACSSGPCSNDEPSAGCENSTGAGAGIRAQGDPLAGDVNLLVGHGPPGQPGIFFQGDLPQSVSFGDGILCASGGIVRVTPTPLSFGPEGSVAFGPCFGDPSIPSITGVVPGSGVIRRYQFWYRDPLGPCGQGFNLSSGLAITW